jgi:Flp pilus assembly protein TadG
MALTLPILLLILFGIIISVFIFYAIIQVSNATREGARAGSVYRLTMNDGTSTSLDDAVKNAIYDPGVNVSALGSLSTSSPSFDVDTDVFCTLNGSPCSAFDTGNPPHAGDQLSVRVRYRYPVPVVSVALPMFPQPMVLVRTVVMEVQ